MSRRPATMALIAASIASAAAARPEGEVAFQDFAGDAVVRRTDPGNDGPVNPAATPPDIVELRIAAWQADDPAVDPYTGTTIDPSAAHLVRVDLEFAGHVNPPGPLGLNGEEYDPYRFGDSPVYGFIDFDIDDDKDSGGEFDPVARNHFLANTSRFASRPEGSLGERAAVSGDDYDSNMDSDPEYERSGADWSLAFCGCFDVFVVSKDGGDQDDTFETGETWIVRGRFFPRAGGYQCASAAEGGSDFGLYDPHVNLRFSSTSSQTSTTVTIVYALDMQGAAALAGQPEEPIDLRADNHTSIEEGLQDIVDGADGGLFGDCERLAEKWEQDDPGDYLDPTEWTATALVGMPYSYPQSSFYAWTDAAFTCTPKDPTGDGVSDVADQVYVVQTIAQNDGGPADADGLVNGSFQLANFAANFHLADLNYDGLVNPSDLNEFCAADCDRDGTCDENETDCDGNGVPDDCEVLNDCNGNGVPDDCELLADCNANGIPDECETLADCNGNGTPDMCEPLNDCNANGVPDVCEPFCPADLAPPWGVLNIFDFLAYQSAFGETDPCADLAPPYGVINIFDFLDFQSHFGQGC